MKNLKQVFEDALKLSEKERAILAARILGASCMTDAMKADCCLDVLRSLPLPIAISAVQRMMMGDNQDAPH